MGIVFICRHYCIQQSKSVISSVRNGSSLNRGNRELFYSTNEYGCSRERQHLLRNSSAEKEHLHQGLTTVSHNNSNSRHHSTCSVYNNNNHDFRINLKFTRKLGGRASSVGGNPLGDDDDSKLSTKQKVRERISNVEKRMKDFVHRENIATVPNMLSFSRLLMSPLIGYLVLQEQYIWSLSLFAAAGVTDWLDGFIARTFITQQSFLGSMLDPLADKLLVGFLTISLTMVHLLPLPVTVLIVTRDLFLILSTAFFRFKNLPSPRTLQAFIDVRTANLRIEPFFISKVNTALQLSLVGFTLASPVFNYVDHPVIQALWYLTSATTIISGIQYTVFNSFTILKKT